MLLGEVAAPDHRVAVRCRTSLVYSRRMGLDFTTAWPDAIEDATRGLRGMERRSWVEALVSTRFAWESAYEGQVRVICPIATMID